MDFSEGLDIYTMISDQLNDLDVGVLGEWLVERRSDEIKRDQEYCFCLSEQCWILLRVP